MTDFVAQAEKVLERAKMQATKKITVPQDVAMQAVALLAKLSGTIPHVTEVRMQIEDAVRIRLEAEDGDTVVKRFYQRLDSPDFRIEWESQKLTPKEEECEDS